MTSAFKQTTSTTLVQEALIGADDFMTAKMLVKTTGRNCRQVSAALCHLRKYQAADCMAVGEELWWFITPNSDQRNYAVEEKTPETKPRKQRKKKLA